jgi:hypothetical protein
MLYQAPLHRPRQPALSHPQTILNFYLTKVVI